MTSGYCTARTCRIGWRVAARRTGVSILHRAACPAFGDIGVHWCDLMEFVTGHRIPRLVASTANAYRERGGEAVGPRTVRSCCSRPTRARPDRSS